MPGSEPRGRFVTHWLPALAWMVVIFAGTSMPRPPALGIEGGDKIAHFVAYAVLGALLLRAFRGGAGCGIGVSAWATVLWGSAYGAFDEAHQAFLITRTCSALDLAADVIGVSAAAIIGYIIGRRLDAKARRVEHITMNEIEEMTRMSEELTLGQDNFESEIIQSEVPCLVDFWAPWCGPCLMMAPALEKLAESVGDTAKVGKVNVDENPELANNYGIRSIPALLFFKGGEVVDTMVGVQPEDALKAKLDGLMD